MGTAQTVTGGNGTITSLDTLNAAQQAYVLWAGKQLGIFTDEVKIAVQAARPGTQVSVQWYADEILVNSFNRAVNLPDTYWRASRGYYIENENYQDVVPTFYADRLNRLFTTVKSVTAGSLGTPPQNSSYYSGIASTPTDGKTTPFSQLFVTEPNVVKFYAGGVSSGGSFTGNVTPSTGIAFDSTGTYIPANGNLVVVLVTEQRGAPAGWTAPSGVFNQFMWWKIWDTATDTVNTLYAGGHFGFTIYEISGFDPASPISQYLAGTGSNQSYSVGPLTPSLANTLGLALFTTGSFGGFYDPTLSGESLSSGFSVDGFTTFTYGGPGGPDSGTVISGNAQLSTTSPVTVTLSLPAEWNGQGGGPFGLFLVNPNPSGGSTVSGFVYTPPGDMPNPALWQPIVADINYAIAQQWGIIYVWSYTQVQQTGLLFFLAVTGSLALVDETGENPLPPGVLVSVVDPWGNSVGNAYSTPGGLVAIPVQPNISYVATLYGTQVRGVPTQSFTGTQPPTQIIITNYRSPCLSVFGYTQEQMEALPTDDFPVSAKLPGGIAYSIGSGFSGALVSIDYAQQLALAANRLVTSTGSALDSWAQDFIGPGVWSRGPSEGDTDYLARIMLWLQTKKGTLNGIQTLLRAYLTASIDLATLGGALTLDSGGALDIVGALDSRGGVDLTLILPSISVFDYQSDAALSAAVGLVRDEAQFCILFSYPNTTPPALWYAGIAHIGVDTFLGSPAYYTITSTQAPPGIDALVQVIKIIGSKPIYVSNTQPM